MNKKEELLTTTMEECAEVAIECSKMLRFDNAPFKLEKEIGDLLCMFRLLESNNILSLKETEDQIVEKEKKLKRWSNVID